MADLAVIAVVAMALALATAWVVRFAYENQGVSRQSSVVTQQAPESAPAYEPTVVNTPIAPPFAKFKGN